MAKITYANKVTLNPQPSIADENKVTDDDMNEIKSVVNGLIVNSKSIDDEKAYSCEYINNLNTYSTTEQRIGTWIDGKPLYRKVIEKTSGISTGSNAISHGISDLKELVSTSGYYVRADNKQGTLPRIATDNNWLIFFGDIFSTTINLNVGSNYVNTFALSKVYVVIEYTKTTD